MPNAVCKNTVQGCPTASDYILQYASHHAFPAIDPQSFVNGVWIRGLKFKTQCYEELVCPILHAKYILCAI